MVERGFINYLFFDQRTTALLERAKSLVRRDGGDDLHIIPISF